MCYGFLDWKCRTQEKNARRENGWKVCDRSSPTKSNRGRKVCDRSGPTIQSEMVFGGRESPDVSGQVLAGEGAGCFLRMRASWMIIMTWLVDQ